MDWKIELIPVPVTDVDKAKAFYVDQVGFNADHDFPVSPEVRFVQLTPPGSACSIVIGLGITDMVPGSQRIQIVVPNAEEAKAHLESNGIEAAGVDEEPWGRFVYFSDPDGNRWSLQQLPPPEGGYDPAKAELADTLRSIDASGEDGKAGIG
jgi:catechol 2,3-dioxygenase-like lactoylglutathione lyase family enzyme